MRDLIVRAKCGLKLADGDNHLDWGFVKGNKLEDVVNHITNGEYRKLQTENKQLKKQLEEQVVRATKAVLVISTLLESGNLLLEMDKVALDFLSNQTSPKLTAQFEADAMLNNMPDKIEPSEAHNARYCLGWNDFHREMRLIADQLTKGGE